jgi:hypothetical protein
VLLFGNFNDEPFDIAVVDHLQASSELDRMVGPTNEIKSFKNETAARASGAPSSSESSRVSGKIKATLRINAQGSGQIGGTPQPPTTPGGSQGRWRITSGTRAYAHLRGTGQATLSPRLIVLVGAVSPR